MIHAGLVNASCVTFRVGDTLILLSGAVGIGPRCREGLPARPGRSRADPLPVQSRTPGGTHRSAYHRRLPPPARPGTPAARQRQPGLPPPGRAAPAPARRARQVGICQAGLALLDARRPGGPDALRPGVGRHVAGCAAPHRAVPARTGRRRGALDRDPAGPDHIHLVAMLARQDRTRPRVVNERYRVRDACLAAEQRYGLRSTAPADRTAARRPTRAETGKAARQHRDEPTRTTLRRHASTAAASAASTEEFVARLNQAGVLVRLRYSVTNPGQVTGYAVALPDDTTRNGQPVWYGGGKLAADLSWPKLQQRWTRPARPDTPLTAAEADAMWDYAARPAADATARIRFCTATGNPAAAADAAYAASDALHVAAAALGSRTLRCAADDYDRAARQPYGRIPAPTPAGNQLRHAARLISAYAYLTGDRTLPPVVLLVRLAALAEAVAELRESQQRAAQAAAALRAARHLRTATRPAPPTRPPGRPATATTDRK